ncbi:MAG: FtsQ-type POTRA domain-containing protein [Limnobacter sp.]|nr:FtsQ-type POTRA domain-containing protein [Limnobacter sp.]
MFETLWNDSRLMSLLAGLLGLVALGLFSAAVASWFIHQPWFDLRKVELVGDVEPLNLTTFEATVLPQVQGSFFSARLGQVRELVQAQPWVRKAVIQRAWPDTLRVVVESHRPLGVWGESRLVNTFGEVFSANLAEVDKIDSLPQLSGPSGSELLVAKMLARSSQVLGRLGMVVKKVRLSERYAWTLQTDSELTIELGREQDSLTIEDKLHRFVAVYPRVTEELMQTVKVMDMRYPLGVAVRGKRLEKVAEHVRAAATNRFTPINATKNQLTYE